MEDLIAGLIIGALVAAALAWLLIKALKAYRKAKAKWRRIRRTRLVVTQAPRRRARSGRRR